MSISSPWPWGNVSAVVNKVIFILLCTTVETLLMHIHEYTVGESSAHVRTTKLYHMEQGAQKYWFLWPPDGTV